MSRKPRTGVGHAVDVLRCSGLRWLTSLAIDRVLPIGVLRLWRDRPISVESLAEQLSALFAAWGMPAELIPITVGHVLYADVHGIDSHGCAMMIQYYRQLHDGTLTIAPSTTVVNDDASTALLDGGGGLGHAVADRAMKTAISKARETGVGMVGVRNSGHFGAAGTYAAMATEAGLIGIATTSTREPSVLPTFGDQAMFGTNPIAFAAPAKRNPPFLLDMATSAAAVGKMAMSWRRGQQLPEGMALDKRGEPQTNARRAFRQRRLTPLGSAPETGSHKGYGLAAMVEILAALLPGTMSKRWFPESSGGVGHFFVAIDVARFRDPSEFTADVDRMIDTLHASKPLHHSQPVLVAGDPERAAATQRSDSGIPLSRSVFENLRWLAWQAEIPFALDGN